MVFTLHAHFLPLSALTAEIAKFCFAAGRQRCLLAVSGGSGPGNRYLLSAEFQNRPLQISAALSVSAEI